MNFFKKTAGIIGFDFSVHDDMPIIEQKSQINLNLKLTYFYAKNGIKIIPNIRCGSDELQPEFFDSIPKHSLISIGVHGFIKHCYQKHEWVHFIRLIIDYLNPTGIIVVGHLDQWIKDIFKKEVNFYQYDSYMDLRNKEVLNNVN